MHTCHPFTGHDIRGRALQEVTPELARSIGAAFVQLLETDTVLLGYDVRAASAVLALGFADGARDFGAHVVHLGLTATDCLSYASGAFNLPGAMITGGRSPAGHSGIRFVHPGAVPVDRDNGLEDLHMYLHTGRLPQHPQRRPGHGSRGQMSNLDISTNYTAHLRARVNLDGIRQLYVVADAASGTAGLALPRLLDGAGVLLEPLGFDPDDAFPRHDPDPTDVANLLDVRTAVINSRADIGLAFDGDAGRCVVVDETGAPVSPSAVLALLAAEHLRRDPGAVIVHDLTASHATVEAVHELGGIPMRARAGRAAVRSAMREHRAALGGEASGSYFFQELWGAESGQLAALHLLAVLGSQPLPLSQLLAPYQRYTTCRGITIHTKDPQAALEAVHAHYRDSADELDGLSVELGAGHWFNLRPSTTSPALRLTVEAPDHQAMTRLRDHVQALVSIS